MTQVATIVYVLGILGLFLLDRDRSSRVSKALWIPVIWVSLAGSRMVSQWLGMAPIASASEMVEGSPLDRYILTGLLALGLIVLFRRGQQFTTVLRANGPILLFFLYCAVSVLWSDFPDVAFKRWIKGVGDFVMVLVVLTDPDRPAAIARLLARTSFVLLPLSVLFSKYYPDLGRTYSRFEGTASSTGVATDKNMLGMLCLVLGLGCLWRFLEVWRDKESTRRAAGLIANGTVLAIVSWLLSAANSATSTSCFLLGSGLMVATYAPVVARRRALVHLLVVAVIVTSLSAVFLDFGLAQTVGRDSSLTGRTDIWATALSMASSPLFGTGYGSFWLGERLEKIWNMYWFHPIQAHDGYIEIYLNLGWTGLALFALVVMRGYRNILVAFRQEQEAVRLRLTYFVVGLIYSLTEAAFTPTSLVWIAFLLAAASVPEAYVPEGLDTGAEEPPSQGADLSFAATTGYKVGA